MFYIIVILAGIFVMPAKADETDMRVTLLGTGTPTPVAERFGPSTLVEAGSEKLVFDCGRGCPYAFSKRAFRSRM